MKNVKRYRVFATGLAVLILSGALIFQLSSRAGATGYNVAGNVTTKVNNNTNNYSGVTVYATSPSSNTVIFGPVVTNSFGNYTLSVTTPGTYDIHFVPTFNSGYSPIVDTNVSVTSGQTLDAQFTTPVNHTLSGTLTDNSNNPIPSVTVKLMGSSIYQTTSDANGNYSLTVPAGTYYLYLSANSSSIPNVNNFTLTQTDKSSINLINSDLALNMILKLASVHISLHNAAGQPYGHDMGTHGLAISQNGVTSLYPGDPGTKIIQINSNGFTGSSGTITTIVGASYSALGLDASTYSGSLCESTPFSSIYDCLMAPLTISGDSNVDVPQASPATRNFSGALTDANNTPIPNAQITLVYGDDTSATVSTDSSGAFSVNAEPKKYALKVSYNDATNHIDGLNDFTLTQSTRAIDLTMGDISQNLQVNNAYITVTAYKATGGLNYGAAIDARATAGTVYLYSGDPGEVPVVTSQFINVSNSDATGAIGTIVGAQYSALGIGSSNWVGSMCDHVTGQSGYDCITSPLTVSGNMSVAVPQVE